MKIRCPHLLILSVVSGFFFLVPCFSLYAQLDNEPDDVISMVVMENATYANRVLKLIRRTSASLRLCLSACEFSENSDALEARLLMEVVKQARRGLNIEIILDSSPVNQPAYDFLVRNGVKVFRMKKEIPLKVNMLVSDDYIGVTGSMTWTKESLERNEELEYWIESSEVASMLNARFDEIKKKCEKDLFQKK